MDKGMPNRWLIGFGIIGILPILPLLVVIIFTSSNDTKILPPDCRDRGGPTRLRRDRGADTGSH